MVFHDLLSPSSFSPPPICWAAPFCNWDWIHRLNIGILLWIVKPKRARLALSATTLFIASNPSKTVTTARVTQRSTSPPMQLEILFFLTLPPLPRCVFLYNICRFSQKGVLHFDVDSNLYSLWGTMWGSPHKVPSGQRPIYAVVNTSLSLVCFSSLSLISLIPFWASRIEGVELGLPDDRVPYLCRM